MKNQCTEKIIPVKIKFNTERFDNRKKLETMALLQWGEGFYFSFQNRSGV